MKLSVARLLAIAAIALPMAAIVPLNAPASAQRFNSVNGRNVVLAIHARGRFEKTGPNEWTEFDTAGRPSFHFTESNRDDGSVFLFDAGRKVQVQIDLQRGWIRYAPLGRPWSDLYAITDAQARRGPGGGPFGGPGGWRAPVHGVEVGPIWNQGDAEVKCRALAREVGGEWTGQWWTARTNQMSLCEIRWNRRP